MALFTNFFSGPGTSIQNAGLPQSLQLSLFSLCATAVAILAVYLLLKKFPVVRGWAHSCFHRLFSFFSNKREARLNKVICHHCNKGMGLYNPVYLFIDGEAHIEGICSVCGNFVRARLN